MSRYTRWLQDTIWLQFQGGTLFLKGEDLVHSCRATSSAANAAENAGDEFLTRGHGRGIVMSQLLMLPGMTRLSAECQADFCCQLARYFCANVGFGPYATEALRLRDMYTFTPHLALNGEILAGVFEETVHVLQRAGMDALVKHILMWCVGCVLYLVSTDSDNFLRDLDARAYFFAVELGAYDLLWPRDCPMCKRVFAVAEVQSSGRRVERVCADTIFSGWVECAMRESNTGGGAAASQSLVPAGVDSRHGGQMRGGHMRSFHQGGRVHYYMDLKCYEPNCESTSQTAAHDSPDAARADAMRMGWSKPRTKSWRRVRCPRCAW